MLQLLKGGINLAVTLIGLGVGWLVGQRLTYQWNLRQKRRESDLATAQDLQRLYGDFFAVWKSWNSVVRTAGTPDRDGFLCRAAGHSSGRTPNSLRPGAMFRDDR